MPGILDILNGDGGGILDFLRNNALNQQMPGGLPSDTANYGTPPQAAPMAMAGPNQPSPLDTAAWPSGPVGGPTDARAAMPAPIAGANQPSPLDNAQWPAGPVGAPSDANAPMRRPPMSFAPVPQQPPAVIPAAPPAAPAASSPGIGDRLGMAARGFMGNMGAGPIGALMAGTGSLLMGRESDPTAIAAGKANQTVQALIAKGADPVSAQAAVANPDLMKTLITQFYGPQTVTSLGQGYVADKNGKITRAYEPEDKIPAGFAKGEDGNMHFVPGGPADPAYLRLAEAQKKDPSGNYVLGRGGEVVKNNPDGTVTVLHKNEVDMGPGLSSDALDIQARQEAMGDFSGRKNMGRGAQSAKDLQELKNRAARVLMDEYGMTPTEAAAHMSKKYQEFNAQGVGLNAEARTTGVREANLNLILKAADAAIPAALEASDKVARTGWVPINSIIQHGQVMTSDPELKKFGMANLQLAEHWARAMNPTGVMRESDRDKALEFLSTKDSKETYKEAVGQLRTQIERERDAVRSTRGMATMPGAAPETTPSPQSAPSPGKYVWTPGGGLVGAK